MTSVQTHDGETETTETDASVKQEIHVLCLDDDDEFVRMAAQLLELHSNRISATTATTVQQAHDALTTLDIDCVVSDYEMPEADGLAFLQEIQETYGDIPFILFTGKGDEGIASRAIGAGVTDYLQKGTDDTVFDTLTTRIIKAVEQSRMAARTHLAEGKYQAVTDSSADVILTFDEQNRIHLVSPVVESLFGYEPTELEGESVSTLLPGYPWESGEPSRPEAFESEHPTKGWHSADGTGRRKDGTELPVAVIFNEFALDGKRLFTAIIRDDSGREQLRQDLEESEQRLEESEQRLEESEQRLEESEQRLEDLGDELRELVWIAKPAEEELVYVNPRYEEVWGETPRKRFDDPKSFLAHIHPDDRARVQRELDEAPAVGYDVEYRLVHPEAGAYWIRERSIPVPEDAGEIKEVISVAEDITQRKAYEERLERQVTRIDEFAHTLSHDVATPIAVARGRIQLGKETGDISHLDSALKALDRLDEILDEVTDVMREPESLTETEELDLGTVVERVWEEFAQTNVSLSIMETATIRANRSAFTRLLENLIKNALEHGGSSVTVRVGLLDDGFYIEDDGVGISSSVSEDVFSPGTSTEGGTRGFGLTSVKQIASAHGWEIFGEERSRRRGTVRVH